MPLYLRRQCDRTLARGRGGADRQIWVQDPFGLALPIFTKTASPRAWTARGAISSTRVPPCIFYP